LLEDIFPRENKKNLKKGTNNNISQENLIDRKLTPIYTKKLSLLLHDSVNYKDYAIKRKNLNKTTFKEIGINKLRLTFKKFPLKLVKKNNSNININNNDSRNLMPKTLDEIREQNNNSINNINDGNIYNTFMINNDIKEILYNNEEKKIPLQQQKEVYNKFKYKFLYYKPKLVSQLNSPIYTPIVQMNYNKKINYKTTSFKNSLLNKSQTQSQNSMYTDISNLLKTCNSLKALRDEKKLDKDIINNKQKLCEKIKEELFRKNRDNKKKKKILMPRYDFFYYDAKKWNKFRYKDNISNKSNNINNLYNNVDKVSNESIQNVNNKSNFYSNKLLKLKNA
jgi:hypothetical protein